MYTELGSWKKCKKNTVGKSVEYYFQKPRELSCLLSHTIIFIKPHLFYTFRCVLELTATLIWLAFDKLHTRKQLLNKDKSEETGFMQEV